MDKSKTLWRDGRPCRYLTLCRVVSDLSIIQSSFSITKCQILTSRFATFVIAVCHRRGSRFSTPSRSLSRPGRFDALGSAALALRDSGRLLLAALGGRPSDSALEPGPAAANSCICLCNASPCHTAIKKLRIVRLGFGTARQKRVLE
jgi:hypothetical protein